MKKIELGDLVFEIVHNPMETLSEAQQEEYKIAFVPAVREAFGNPEITESDVQKHALEVDTTIFVKDNSGANLGFSSSSIEHIRGVDVIYLQGTALSNLGKGKKLYNVVIPLRILEGLDKLSEEEAFVVTRTASPIVYLNMVNKLGMFPQQDKDTPLEMIEISEGLAQLIYDHHSDFRAPGGLQFDRSELVQRMAYGLVDENGVSRGFCMYGDNIPWCKDNPLVNDYLKQNVDFHNGDALVMVGRTDRETAEYLLKIAEEIHTPYTE